MAQGRRPDLRGARDPLTAPAESGAPAVDGSSVHVIFNPASGRGRGGRRMDAYRTLLNRHLPGHREHVSERPGHEAELADRAIAEGAGTVVAVGGDGTWSHVADRIVESGREGVRFGVLPSGTGNDFGRSLGLDFRSPGEAVEVLAAGRSRAVDVGRVLTPCAPDRGRSGVDAYRARHFLNVVGFGFDIAVLDAAARARFLKGELLYKVTALTQLFRFPGVDVDLRDSAGDGGSRPCLMLTISNGRYFGGGFPIAPHATVHDGELHACFIGDASPLERMLLFNRAERGRHVESPRVELKGDRRFAATFAEPPRFEIDGDVYAARDDTVEVEILPGALPVVTP